MFRLIFLFGLIIYSFQSASQTIVMNEVSNGPSGNMEYAEFIVVDTSSTYNCVGITNPPCIDLRGWIFDDNSGYHGSAGVASGCIRFSNNPFWSCIPVGTILLIYNDQDPNTSLPAIDTSMTDGNCRIVVPVNKENWFDRNGTTPGAIACSYPATGWLASGSWSTTLLANGGDCARIVNTAGCEVFSVCWGTANLFPLIYFAGSAQDRVYFFNNSINNDASNIGNWTNGCADPAACSINQQTPGAPNNPANAAWINSMNNSCNPVQPLTLNINATAGACPCSASSTVSTNGSLPPFSYTWSPTPGSGQGTPIAGGLCNGTYTCLVKSNTTKCTETIIVNVTNSNTLTINATNTGTYCEGNTILLNADAADSYTWSGPSGFNSNNQNPSISNAVPGMSGNYTLQASAGNCTAQSTTSLTVFSAPATTISLPSTVCVGGIVTFSAGSGFNYLWNGPNSYSSSLQSNTINPVNTTSGGVYSLSITDNNLCTNSYTFLLNVNPLPIISASFQPACENGTLNLNAGGAQTYTWTGPGGFSSNNANPIISNITSSSAGTYSLTGTDANGCENSITVNVTIISPQNTTINGNNVCSGETLTLSATGGTSYVWTGPNTFNSGSQNVSINQASLVNSGIYTVIISDGVCPSTTRSLQINVLPNPTLNILALDNTPCYDSAFVISVSGAATYTWTGPAGLSAVSSSLSLITTKSTEGTYTVIGIGSNGCISSAEFPLIGKECSCKLFIPEGFSPNGDGVHDLFTLTCTEGKTISIEIYNRWGNLIYKNTNYKNNWDGKANTGLGINGSDLPEGTYFYLINLNDGSDIQKGYITLLR